MRDQQIHTFHKGLDSDTSPTFVQNGTYTHATDIKISSKGSPNSGGAITTPSGNALMLNLTYSMEMETVYSYQNGVYTGMVLDRVDEIPCYIIGHAFIRNILVVFTVAEGETTLHADKEESHSIRTSVIFEVDIDTKKSKIIYENKDLNFSRKHPITAVGRYESSSIQRVYWTDGVNTVKALNIKDPYVKNIDINEISLVPSVDLPVLKVQNIVSGGNLPAGVYQYAYRLKSSTGQETKFTMFTNPISVVAGSDYWKYVEDPEGDNEKNGTEPGKATGRAVQLYVSDINQNYETIEFLAIYRKHSGGESASPVERSYVFSASTINSDSMSITHSSDDTREDILLEEATSFEINLASAKTIATKDNRLFLGGISESVSDLMFNARAYRYKREDSTEIHYPYKAAGTSTYVTAPDSLSVEEGDEDAINPFNNLNSNNFSSPHKYKYQKNGAIIGGEGPFVKYKFTKQKISGDTALGDHPSTPPFISSDEVEVGSEGFAGENNKGDYKSGVISAKYRGYQRDEVYRFGVVLYNKQGSPGFVNWVGDIRFPSIDDIDIAADNDGNPIEPTSDASNTEGTHNFSLSQTDVSQSGHSYYTSGSAAHKDLTVHTGTQISDIRNAVTSENDNTSDYAGTNVSAGTHYLYALGIEFMVEIPEDIKDSVSGYSIVRTKRKQRDKTVLGVGLLNYLNAFERAKGSPGHIDNPYPAVWWMGYGKTLDYFAGVGNARQHHGKQISRFWTVDSPEFAFSQEYPAATSSDYFQIYGGLTGGGAEDAYGKNAYATNGNHRKYYSHLMRGVKNSSVAPFIEIEHSRKFKYEDRLTEGLDVYLKAAGEITTFTGNFAFEHELGYQNALHSPGALSTGEDTLLAVMSRTQELVTGEAASNVEPENDWEYNDAYEKESLSHWGHYLHYSGGTSTTFTGLSTGTKSLKSTKDKLLVAWRRDLGEGISRTQYGGVDSNARAYSTYISTGHYTSVSDKTPQKVFGGDTYVTFYDIEKVNFYKDSDFNESFGFSHSDSNHSQTESSFSYAYPVETTINTTLRLGWHYANKHDFRNNGETRFNSFDYNDVYSAENDLIVYIPKPSTQINESSTFDNRILYSNVKENSSASDGWRSFRSESYVDLDGNKGGIVKLVNFKDNLYFIQTNGFGAMSINPTSAVIDQSGASIVLGKGDVIQDFKYISETIGAPFASFVVASGAGIYLANPLTSKLYSFRANGFESLSDVKRVSSLVSTEFMVPTEKINTDYLTLGYDPENSEILFSNKNTGKTLVFNEQLNVFTSFYSYYTNIFIPARNMLSIKDNSIYTHSSTSPMSWFTVPMEPSLKLLVNKYPTETKIFDNLDWHQTLKGGIETVSFFGRATGGYIDEEVNLLDPEDPNYFPYLRETEDSSKLPVPRTKSETRIRAKYLSITLKAKKGAKVLLYSLKTLFRISKR